MLTDRAPTSAKRYALQDDQWNRIKDFLLGRPDSVGPNAKDNRLFVDAVPYRDRADILWADLPPRFGDPCQIHNRYRCWTKLRGDPNTEAIGRSQGGLGPKIHAAIDSQGRPTGFALTLGQASDLAGADLKADNTP